MMMEILIQTVSLRLNLGCDAPFIVPFAIEQIKDQKQ